MDGHMRGVWKDNSGVTVVELLISLILFTLIVSMLPVVFSIWVQPTIVTMPYEEKVLFTSQLQLDFRSSNNFWTDENGTILYFSRASDNATVQYEIYQDKIRRRVNSTGHEVFLQYVKGWNVSKKGYGVSIVITGVDGKEYFHTIPYPQYIVGDYDG